MSVVVALIAMPVVWWAIHVAWYPYTKYGHHPALSRSIYVVALMLAGAAVCLEAAGAGS